MGYGVGAPKRNVGEQLFGWGMENCREGKGKVENREEMRNILTFTKPLQKRKNKKTGYVCTADTETSELAWVPEVVQMQLYEGQYYVIYVVKKQGKLSTD